MIDGVDKSDTQKINTVKYGTLVAAEPVKIKGEDDGLGAITGGLLGAVIGCGEGIFDDECRDTVAVVGAIGGAIIGNAVASRLGDHNGFQYVVDIDDSDDSKNRFELEFKNDLFSEIGKFCSNKYLLGIK